MKLEKIMTEEQATAYKWALNQQFSSVAARHARTLAFFIKHHKEYIEAGICLEQDFPNWRHKFPSLDAAVRWLISSQHKLIERLRKKLELIGDEPQTKKGSKPVSGDAIAIEIKEVDNES